MNPIRALFSGTCARTGQPYQANDLIVKLANGKWALAQTKREAIKTAPDWRLCLLPDGTEKQLPVHLPAYCSQCMRAAGHDPANRPKDLTPYTMERRTDSIVCPRCSRTLQIIPQAELDRREAVKQAEYEVQARADLHLENAGYGFYTLSHRLHPEQWNLVARFFRYWSHDDLDQMDYFDMPGGYYVQSARPQTTELLNSAPPSDLTAAEEIERILGIKPENTLVELEKRATSARSGRRSSK